MNTADSFRFLHPLSVLFEIAKTIRNNLIPTVAALLSARSGSWVGYSIGTAILSIGLVVALVRYFTFRYRIEDDALVIHQGLWGRLNRTIPLSRIQNIDLSQNVFHRMLGVGEVRVETASGTEPEAVMRVLALADVNLLRKGVADQKTEAQKQLTSGGIHSGAEHASSGQSEQTLLDIPIGSSTEASAFERGIAKQVEPAQPEATSANNPPAKVLLQLPPRLILFAGLISNRGEVIAGILFGLFWQTRFGGNYVPWADPTGRFSRTKYKGELTNAIEKETLNVRGIFNSISENYGLVGSVVFGLLCLVCIFAILRVFSSLWYLSKFYGYRLELQGDAMHLQCGLLTKISATIPLGRVQLISIHRTWLMRRFGLASIRVETAGGSKQSDDGADAIGRKWFVPIIPYPEVPRILASIDSRVEYDDASFEWKPLANAATQRMIRPLLLACVLLSVVFGYFQPYWGWSVGIPTAVLGVLWIKKKSRSKRYARTDWGVLFRSGVVRQKCSMTFFDKIQSVTLHQTPFDRRWQMASLSVDTLCSGPADHRIEIEMLDSDFANQELEQVSEKVR